MSLPKEIQQLLENSYGALLSFHFSSGGCINSGGVARFKRETIFVKWNSIEKYPGMFKAEAKGLDLLRQADLKVPEVYFIDNTTSLSFLVLEYIGSEARGSAYWQELGHGLAQLHKIHNDSYGLDHDNYMGSLKQYNEPSFHWLDFFIRYRIDPQVKLASENGYISTSELRRIHSFKKNIANILTEEKPSLVHGDLWSGNIMIDSNKSL